MGALTKRSNDFRPQHKKPPQKSANLLVCHETAGCDGRISTSHLQVVSLPTAGVTEPQGFDGPYGSKRNDQACDGSDAGLGGHQDGVR